MERCTWHDGKGNWGIKGVDLTTLPTIVYDALFKLQDIEKLAQEIQAASNRPGYDYDYLMRELLILCGVRHGET